MINKNKIITMNNENTVITIPNEILLSIWTLPKNENKNIGDVLPEVIETIQKILKKMEIKND